MYSVLTGVGPGIQYIVQHCTVIQIESISYFFETVRTTTLTVKDSVVISYVQPI